MRGRRGQAALEVLAAVPAVVLAALLAWQLVAVLAAGIRAQERVREEGLRATGPPGRTLTVRAETGVPRMLPGLPAMRVRAEAGVRAP